jgi:hypothetical protein
MTKIETRGANVGDSADWNDAFKVISQLAEARATTLREIDADARDASASPASPAALRTEIPTPSPPSPAPVAPDQLARDMADIELARDMAEIERAAAALRRTEPALERRLPEDDAVTTGEPRSSRSVWMLVGVIWMTAVLVVACTIGAVVLVLA